MNNLKIITRKKKCWKSPVDCTFTFDLKVFIQSDLTLRLYSWARSICFKGRLKSTSYFLKFNTAPVYLGHPSCIFSNFKFSLFFFHPQGLVYTVWRHIKEMLVSSILTTNSVLMNQDRIMGKLRFLVQEF